MSSKLKELFLKEWEFAKLITSYFSTHITRVSLNFVTIYFAGTLSQAHLDGVGLAITLYNVCARSLTSGYSFVFETYGPQVYGPSQSGELSSVLVKCLLHGAMIHLVIVGPYLNLVYVIGMLPQSDLNPILDTGEIAPEGQTEDFRAIAVKFLRMTVFFQLLEYTFMMTSTYFAIQGQKKFVYVACLVMAAMHACFS